MKMQMYKEFLILRTDSGGDCFIIGPSKEKDDIFPIPGFFKTFDDAEIAIDNYLFNKKIQEVVINGN